MRSLLPTRRFCCLLPPVMATRLSIHNRKHRHTYDLTGFILLILTVLVLILIPNNSICKDVGGYRLGKGGETWARLTPVQVPF